LRLLLDTHIFLWSLTQSDALSPKAWSILNEPQNELSVSAVSVWEIAIKFARRRGLPDDMPISGSDALAEIYNAKFNLLSVNGAHAAAVDHLLLKHRDPFDRLLIAQAKSEPMILLTHDKALADYGDFVMLV
jgi:PIN domain nuclease of toxin-antitoxin system